jgi:hypothetical protein
MGQCMVGVSPAAERAFSRAQPAFRRHCERNGVYGEARFEINGAGAGDGGRDGDGDGDG